MSEVSLNSANFAEHVLNNNNTVLVDFWAEWCGPCKMMGPILAEIAQELAGQPITIAKCNIDENNELAQQYNVMSIPSFKIFKNGKVVEEWVGAQTKDGVKQRLAKYLNS